MISPIPTLGNSGVASGVVKGTLDKDAFLQLLITQLKHQDPLNPLDSTEFIAQMARFATVEQLQNLNQSVVAASFLAQLSAHNALASSFIGQDIEANGTMFEVGSGTVSLTYTLPEEAKAVTVEILNLEGQVVRTILLGDQGKGDHKMAFDGKDDNGVSLPAGQYLYRVAATDPRGKPLSGITTSSGKVQGVSFEENQPFLLLDGARVPFTSVIKVAAPGKEAS